MDNAIDSAVAIYLDFANLFIRLLALFGDLDDD
jgi:FtsH-binding integral membrane protein